MYIYIYIYIFIYTLYIHIYRYIHMNTLECKFTIFSPSFRGSGPERGEGLLLRAPRPARSQQVLGRRVSGFMV